MKHLLNKEERKKTWRRIHLEKLTVTPPVKKFPAFYGTQRIITKLTTACHWTLSSAA
jgi:hypothetical protein